MLERGHLQPYPWIPAQYSCGKGLRGRLRLRFNAQRFGAGPGGCQSCGGKRGARRDFSKGLLGAFGARNGEKGFRGDLQENSFAEKMIKFIQINSIGLRN